MSSAHEANTQRLMAALRDKETALKVRPLGTTQNGSVAGNVFQTILYSFGTIVNQHWLPMIAYVT